VDDIRASRLSKSPVSDRVFVVGKTTIWAQNLHRSHPSSVAFLILHFTACQWQVYPCLFSRLLIWQIFHSRVFQANFQGWPSAEQHPIPCLHPRSIPSHRIQNGACPSTVQPRRQIRHHQPSDPICRRVLHPYNPLSVTSHSADPPALRPQVRGEARYLFSDPNPFAAI
jgi:hypothetical protein